ncbi:nucleoporin p58/p45-like, partial [Stegodyphus dumicola]|uniref:nucleoporin p58/p45-like n=1 Tax=Stegodyphus dumicola TaxID=202533 RepID=UPI0015ABA471
TATATQPTIGTNPLGSTAPFGGGILGGTAATTTTTSLFGATQTAPSFSSSLFPTATTTSSAFPTLGQTSVSSAAPGGFSFGGFGNTATSSSLSFGQSLSSVSTTPSTLTTPSVGLGGVDIQTATGLNGASTSQKKDGKAVKETQIPNEISVTVESFKKYVKEQKAIREEMSRVSSKNIFRVQEQVVALRQQLSVVSNGLQRNAIAIAKLKEESNQELKNAEIAQRTKDSPSSLQYENNAPTEYFHNLANSFEKQMQSYRQQIEQLERQLLSLSQPYTLTPNEWTAIRRRLHDVFVTLAAQLQTIHQEVQVYKEHFINNQRLNHGDIRNLLQNRKDSLRDNAVNTQLLSSVTYGPSPFAAVQSAVGKAITNVFGRSQQLPGGSTTLGNLGSSGFDSGQYLKPF